MMITVALGSFELLMIASAVDGQLLSGYRFGPTLMLLYIVELLHADRVEDWGQNANVSSATPNTC